MLTIDAQVHAYERDHPGRPWAAVLPGEPEATGDGMVAAMDRVDVDGALLVSPFTLYRYDASYALEVHAAHPGRFGLIKPVDITDPGVADTIAEWAATNGAVGIRIMMNRGVSTDPADPGINRVLAVAARHALPVNLLCAGLSGSAVAPTSSAPRASERGDSLPPGTGESDSSFDGKGRLEQVAEIAKQNPNTRLVIDHLGLLQPIRPPAPAEPFAELPKVLALAKYDNVAIKITGACTLSREAFPYRDIWDPLGRIFDAFGLERCMWGTDWTRAVGLLTYEQGVEAFRVTDRLSDTDRAALMGETVQRIYRWSPSMTA